MKDQTPEPGAELETAHAAVSAPELGRRSQPELQRLHSERERIIAQLAERFAQGELEMEDFENKLDEVHRMPSLSELQHWSQDNQAIATASAVPSRPLNELIPAARAPLQKQVLAIFGSSKRRGSWTVPRKLRVSAVFGNIELDFREARMPAGIVELSVNAAFGNVEITVPPTLAVETEGAGVFGNFEHKERAPAVPDPHAPMLRITGLSVFGNIEITTKLAKPTRPHKSIE